MPATYLRIQPATRPVEWLLDPAKQVSTIWDWQGQTRRCAECRGTGSVDHVCGTDTWWCRDGECSTAEDDCGACDGRGEVDDDERAGVSVCMTEHQLFLYFRGRYAHLDDVVLVEIEGDHAEDDDFDADGPGDPFLIHPTRVVAVHDASDLVAAIRAYEAGDDDMPMLSHMTMAGTFQADVAVRA